MLRTLFIIETVFMVIMFIVFIRSWRKAANAEVYVRDKHLKRINNLERAYNDLERKYYELHDAFRICVNKHGESIGDYVMKNKFIKDVNNEYKKTLDEFKLKEEIL